MTYFATSDKQTETSTPSKNVILSMTVDDYWIRVFKCVSTRWWGGETSVMTSGYFYTTHICSALTFEIRSDNFKWEIEIIKFQFCKIFPPLLLWLLPSSLMLNVPLKRKKNKTKTKGSFFQAFVWNLVEAPLESITATNFAHLDLDNLPLFSADPLRVCQGWMGPLRRFQVWTFSNIQSCPWATPSVLRLVSSKAELPGSGLSYSSTLSRLAFPQPWSVSIFKLVKHTSTSWHNHHASP